MGLTLRGLSRQSLVTPIDWKPVFKPACYAAVFDVSPILGDAY